MNINARISKMMHIILINFCAFSSSRLLIVVFLLLFLMVIMF